jgi:hypothetical protein
MRRRNYLIGLGSLAAGSAAAVGTGAFTSASAERTVNVNVAADASGFLEVQAMNDTYASGTDDGQLELNFNADSGTGVFDGDAEGLNPNTAFDFAEVFKIANVAGLPDRRAPMEASGPDPARVSLAAAGTSASDIEAGTSLRVADYDSVDSLPKLVQPDSVDVDVTMETGDDTGAAGGTLTVHAATGGNRDELSDLL